MSDNNTLYIDGKIAGVIFGDTLRIVKTSKDHYVKRYSGYGVSPETLRTAQARGARRRGDILAPRFGEDLHQRFPVQRLPDQRLRAAELPDAAPLIDVSVNA